MMNMKIKLNQTKIPNKLELSQLVPDNDFLNLSVSYLTDGYELTELEQSVYSKNNVFIDKVFLNHKTAIQYWFDIESDNIFCHHSALLYRYSFENYLPQILKLKSQRKELLRFLDLKSKYGIDFYLQFIGENSYCDIIHIENDYFDFDELLNDKQKIEEFLLSTDWENVGLKIFEKKSEWCNLLKDDQFNWKANYFGFPKAFMRKK